MIVAVPDPLGAVVLRVVPDDAWAILAERKSEGPNLAPRAAVALDLMESADPRHWVAAEQLVSEARD